jgi:hypothetical protein
MNLSTIHNQFLRYILFSWWSLVYPGERERPLGLRDTKTQGLLLFPTKSFEYKLSLKVISLHFTNEQARKYR